MNNSEWGFKMTNETACAMDELSRANALLALLGEVSGGDLGEEATLGRNLVIDAAREHLAAARAALGWVHEYHRIEAGAAEPAVGE